MQGQLGDTPTILLIDDYPDLLYAFSVHLTSFEGMRVTTASDGQQALERYFEVMPDCVVIDVKMPMLDGYQVARALRGDPASAHTPLIILTAMVQEQDHFLGLAAGVDRYLNKPVKPSELAAIIREVLQITQEERQRQQQQFAEDVENRAGDAAS